MSPISYFECKGIFDQLESNEIDLYLEACELIWNSKSVNKDTAHDKLAKITQNSNLFVLKDDELQFINPELLFFGQALNLVNERDISSIPPVELVDMLIKNLRDSEDHDIREQMKLSVYAFVHLINIFNRIDLLDLIASDELSDQIFWDISPLFRESIPVIDTDVNLFGDFLISVAEKGKGDLAGSAVYGAAEQIGTTRLEIGYGLINFFSHVDNPVVVGFIESLMTGIANYSEDNAKTVISQCESWLYIENSLVAQSALYSLQNLVIQQKYGAKSLLEHITRLLDTPFDDLRVGLALTLTSLGLEKEEVSEDAIRLLQQLKQIGPVGNVVHGISASLSRARKINSFGIACIRLLVDTPIEQKGTIQNIDAILRLLSEANPKFVWDFLENWIKSHDSTEPISQHDTYLNRIQRLYAVSRDVAVSVLTRWFFSSDLRLVEESRLILRVLEIISFSTEHIEQLTHKENIYVIEKILAGGFDSSQISLLVISIIRSSSHLEDLRDYFQQALWYLAWNYPGGSGDVFSRVIKVEDDERVKEILENTQTKLGEYQDNHREVRELFRNELASSLRRVQKYREYEAKIFQQISQASMQEDRHSLLSFIPRISVGRGNRSFHMDIFNLDVLQRRTFSEPNGFGKISGGFELPKGEFLDPEGESWRRFQRRSLQLEDITWEEE